MNNPKYILVHGTDVSIGKVPFQLSSVNTYHRGRDFPLSTTGYYVGYHTFIEKNGVEIITRLPSEVGAHCNQEVDGLSMNLQSLSVCLAGDFDVEMPTNAQILTLQARLRLWQKAYSIPLDSVHIAHHRRYTPWKTCMGSLLADDWPLKLLTPSVKDPEQKDKQIEIERIAAQVSALQKLIERLKMLISLR